LKEKFRVGFFDKFVKNGGSLMREYITKFVPFEEMVTKKVSDGIHICGYGNVYTLVDSVGDVIQRKAFDKSLAEHRKRGTMPAMLFEHKNLVCGKWDIIREDNYGLYLEGTVDDIPSNKDIVNRIKHAEISGLSVGFRVRKAHKEGGVQIVTEGILHEVSLVTSPANDYSRFAPTNVEVIHERRTTNFG